MGIRLQGTKSFTANLSDNFFFFLQLTYYLGKKNNFKSEKSDWRKLCALENRGFYIHTEKI